MGNEFERQLFGDKAPEDTGTTETPVEKPVQKPVANVQGPDIDAMPEVAPSILESELSQLMSGKDELGGPSEPEEPGTQPGTQEAQPASGADPDADSKAFYQARYQKALELAKELDPSYYLQIKQRLSGKATDAPVETPISAPEIGDDFDPQQLMSTIKNLPKVMREEAMRVQREARMEEQLIQEQQRTNDQVMSFVRANNVTQDEFIGALNQVAGLGIKTNELGGPTQAAHMIALILQNNAASKFMQSGVAKIQAAAAGKAEQLQKIAQPQPGAMPTPVERSPEMKFLESMQNAGQNKANREFFKI